MSLLERDAVRSISEDDRNSEHAAQKVRRSFRFLLLVAFLQGISCNLLQPFVQVQAAPIGKGELFLSDGLHGLYLAVVLLLSPLTIGVITHRHRIRQLLRLGLLCDGICCMAYELLRPMKLTPLLCLLRAMQAAGAAFALPCYISILRLQREETSSHTIPIVGSAFVLGSALWRHVGGQLFMSGFFPIPFASVGACLVIASACTSRRLPSTRHKHPVRRGLALSLLNDPRILTDLAVISYSCVASVYSQGTLGYALQKFGMPLNRVNRVLTLLGPANIVTASICSTVGRSQLGTTTFLGWLMAMVGVRLATSAAQDLHRPTLSVIIFSHLMISFGLGADAMCALFHAQNRAAMLSRSVLAQGIMAAYGCASIAIGRLLGLYLYNYQLESSKFLESSMFQYGVELPMLLLTAAMMLGDYVQPEDDISERLGYSSEM